VATAALVIPICAPALPDDAADKAAFETVCGACHPPAMVSDLRTEADWKGTVEAMKTIGATGTDEQFTRLMRYLSRTLTKVNVNTAPASEIAPVLDIDDSAAQALVRYREEHGSFRTLEDVKKVAGIDPAKLLARKDRIAF
jgi:competence protein ComEA